MLTLSTVTDTYGDVPYFEACEGYTQNKFSPAYDEQKEIYRDMFEKLELANEMLADGTDFDALEDYMYDGKVALWRKFGNSLYVRLLMRVALKDESEPNGERLDAVTKLNEIFSNPGAYPVFESRADAANVKFDATVNAQYTPFHNLRAGLWNNNMICERLMDEMYDTEAGLKDPRVNYYFDKLVGVPTQITYNELMTYFDVAAHYRRNVIQDRDHFPLMNYSELYFIWAEAAYRGWIAGTPKEYYRTAVSEAVYEWTDNPSADLTSFLSNARGVDRCARRRGGARTHPDPEMDFEFPGRHRVVVRLPPHGYPEMPVRRWPTTTASCPRVCVTLPTRSSATPSTTPKRSTAGSEARTT